MGQAACCLSRGAVADASFDLHTFCEAADDDFITGRLVAQGLLPETAREKRQMFARAAARLRASGVPGEMRVCAFWVPGRIEVCGKHTDYAGGRSLLAATSKGFAVVSAHRPDDVCRIFTTFGLSREEKSAELRISKDLEPEPGCWTAYPATAIRRLARNFDIGGGVDVAVECDLPEASGMSTSSAVICYMWLVLEERNGIREMRKFRENLPTAEELYSYLGFIENGQNCGDVLVGDKGVGTFGGSEDHTAIMSCRPGKLNMFSYCPTAAEGSFNFPADLTFVVAVSGALAEKTRGSMGDYNNAAFLARDAAAAWCKTNGSPPLNGQLFVPGCANLAEVIRHVRGPQKATHAPRLDAEVRQEVGDAIAEADDGKTFGPGGLLEDPQARAYESGTLRTRFEQFFDESEIYVPGIAKAIAAGDHAQLGALSDESHRQSCENLMNTVPATAWLPQEARRLNALGASCFGAGFGGSCWAIVPAAQAAEFCGSWQAAYNKKFPKWEATSKFFVMAPGPGAFKVR